MKEFIYDTTCNMPYKKYPHTNNPASVHRECGVTRGTQRTIESYHLSVRILPAYQPLSPMQPLRTMQSPVGTGGLSPRLRLMVLMTLSAMDLSLCKHEPDPIN